ncbi:squalene monooxygenase-like [Amphiura filiformis]|uniref:squalene monooxygenase-like n=1 Tax=Amphiura filiformis TaxID=82378 RepID=UPI003B21F375
MSSSNSRRVVSLPKLGPPPIFSGSDPDIIVVGGGILGATFAARLGMDGKRVVMIERDMGTPETFRGEILLPGGRVALEKLGMKDIFNDVDGNELTRVAFYDIELGGQPEPAIYNHPAPGSLAMRHGSIVNALRKKALAQKSVTVIEAVVKELIKENGRVVGVKYHEKGKEEILEKRAPLVVVGDGHYSKLSKEFCINNSEVSDSCVIAFFLKNYIYQNNTHVIENSFGQPNAQVSVYNLNERDTRCMIWVDGPTPANAKKYCEENVAPYVIDHMKKYFIETLNDNPRISVVRCKRMAANFDITPGVLVLGDAFNARHPIAASGMMVACQDIAFWWDVLKNKVTDLTDDKSMMDHMLQFRTERHKWAFSTNVLAEVAHRLLCDRDETFVRMQQFMFKSLRSMSEEERSKPNDAANIFGGVETDPKVLESVLNGILEGTIQEIYDNQPYLYAVWKANKLRRKWNAVLKEIMTSEAVI